MLTVRAVPVMGMTIIDRGEPTPRNALLRVHKRIDGHVLGIRDILHPVTPLRCIAQDNLQAFRIRKPGQQWAVVVGQPGDSATQFVGSALDPRAVLTVEIERQLPVTCTDQPHQRAGSVQVGKDLPVHRRDVHRDRATADIVDDGKLVGIEQSVEHTFGGALRSVGVPVLEPEPGGESAQVNVAKLRRAAVSLKTNPSLQETVLQFRMPACVDMLHEAAVDPGRYQESFSPDDNLVPFTRSIWARDRGAHYGRRPSSTPGRDPADRDLQFHALSRRPAVARRPDPDTRVAALVYAVLEREHEVFVLLVCTEVVAAAAALCQNAVVDLPHCQIAGAPPTGEVPTVQERRTAAPSGEWP